MKQDSNEKLIRYETELKYHSDNSISSHSDLSRLDAFLIAGCFSGYMLLFNSDMVNRVEISVDSFNFSSLVFIFWSLGLLSLVISIIAVWMNMNYATNLASSEVDLHILGNNIEDNREKEKKWMFFFHRIAHPAMWSSIAILVSTFCLALLQPINESCV